MTKPERENKLKERLADAGRVRRTPVVASAEEDASVNMPAPPAHVPAPAPQVMTKLPWDVVMQRWTTYVDRDVLLQLHAFARRTGVSRAQIVSEGIAMWLRENGGG